jgi:hypothetical protein
LEGFTQQIKYSKDILQTLEQEKKYQEFADQVSFIIYLYVKDLEHPLYVIDIN